MRILYHPTNGCNREIDGDWKEENWRIRAERETKRSFDNTEFSIVLLAKYAFLSRCREHIGTHHRDAARKIVGGASSIATRIIYNV